MRMGVSLRVRVRMMVGLRVGRRKGFDGCASGWEWLDGG